MKSIYKSGQSKKAVWELYDSQMEDLKVPYMDLFLNTSFGKTHIIECGNLSGKPLLVFHGGNATTAYNLKYCRFLLKDFHIYAVDTIGHPGKSAEVSLSPRNQDYGKWAVDVIKGLGFNEMACLGGSFGAGILVKAMCVAPEAIARSVLLVPSAILNAPAYKSINMAFPMLMYQLTHKEKWFVKCILPMAITESCKNLCKYQNPVLVMAAEKDCLFSAKGVLLKAKKVWPQSKRYLLKDRGHINKLTSKEKKMIIDFLIKY